MRSLVQQCPSVSVCPQDQGVRYICAGAAEQQEGLFVLNLSSNGISSDGIHHVSAMLVRRQRFYCVDPVCLILERGFVGVWCMHYVWCKLFQE